MISEQELQDKMRPVIEGVVEKIADWPLVEKKALAFSLMISIMFNEKKLDREEFDRNFAALRHAILNNLDYVNAVHHDEPN